MKEGDASAKSLMCCIHLRLGPASFHYEATKGNK